MSLLISKFAKLRPRNSRGAFVKLATHQSKEERRAYEHNYNLVHSQKKTQQSVEWARKNKDKRKITKNKWDSLHRDRVNFWASRRRFRVRGAPGTYSKEAVDKLFEQFKMMCYYCNISKATSIDHVIPISRGGSNDISNLVPACVSCNSKKGTKLLSELLW